MRVRLFNALYFSCILFLLLYNCIVVTSADKSLRICLKEVSKKVYTTDAKGKNLNVIKTKSLSVLPKPVKIGAKAYYQIVGNPPSFVLAKHFITCVPSKKQKLPPSKPTTQHAKGTISSQQQQPSAATKIVPIAQVPYSVSNTFCFPVKGESLTDVIFNFGIRAPYATNQCHGAVDITTKGQHSIIAVADGSVLDVIAHDHGCNKGKQLKAILIYHKVFKKTLLYGGLDSNSIKVKQGDAIQKGQPLATVAQCHKLELELYDGRVLRKESWIAIDKEQKQVIQNTNNCLNSPILTKMKPTALEDPSVFLKNIRNLLC